ncbi:MAG: ABC transporter permease, partial [Bacteroidota bacterium]
QEGKFLEHRAAAVPAMQQMFQSSFPEVINYARYHKAATSIVRYVADNSELKFEENEIYFADSEFLDIFDVNLTKGNVSSALNAPNKVIISESMANKYFGDVNPIGKRLLFNGSYAFECEVSGVMSDFKVNTHLAGDFIISLSTKVNLVPMFNIPDNWIWRSFYTYIVVKDLKNVSDLEEKINNSVSQRLGSFYEDRGYKVNYHVQRLEEIHLNSNLFEEIKQNGNSRNLKYLGFIGSFMLLIAIFNYINLSTAKNLKRAKEVGVRKTVGAETSNLKVQFLLESVVVNGIAFILAVLSLWLFFELVVNFLNVTIRFTLLSNLWFWILFFLAWLTISILSGIYPAFILSGLRPVKVMSGSFKSSSGNILFRKALVIMQVCVALGLIIYLLAMFSQIRFMRDRELGIDKENILVVQGPKIKNEAYLSNLEFFKNNIEKDNDFMSMSTVSSLPGEVTGAGRDFRNQSGVSQFLRIIRVEYGFEKVFGLQVLSGNTFSADRSANNSGFKPE